MKNLKIQIKIEDNDNLKEAHDLLLKLGFSTYNEESFGVWDNCPKPIWLKTNCFDDKPNKIDWVDSGDYKPFKITIPELRDLVVLKRNDVGDAISYMKLAVLSKMPAPTMKKILIGQLDCSDDQWARILNAFELMT